jgi:ABC-type transport system involved in Fe-S cluster assembly fused permease/ATPase subunit
MATWSQISRRPLSETWEYVENVVKHSNEDGSVTRRKRYSKDRIRFAVSFDLLNSTDAAVIKALFAQYGLHSHFSFTDKSSTARNVVFEKPLSFVESVSGWYKFDTIVLVEI